MTDKTDQECIDNITMPSVVFDATSLKQLCEEHPQLHAQLVRKMCEQEIANHRDKIAQYERLLAHTAPARDMTREEAA